MSRHIIKASRYIYDQGPVANDLHGVALRAMRAAGKPEAISQVQSGFDMVSQPDGTVQVAYRTHTEHYMANGLRTRILQGYERILTEAGLRVSWLDAGTKYARLELQP